MFASKAKAYPSGAPDSSQLQGEEPGLTLKYQTWLERFGSDKHSSLLFKSLNRQEIIKM